MSLVPASRRHDGGAGSLSRAASQLLMFIAAIAAMLGAVPAAARADEAPPVTKQDMCRAWTADASSPEITLANGLTVSASSMRKIGLSCLAPNAEIRLTGATVEDPGPAGPSGTAAAQVLAAVEHAATGTPDLKTGDELFKGAYLTNFNASLKLGYFAISGAVELKFTGGTVSRFLFKGKLYGVDRLTMTLYSPPDGTDLPNLGGAQVDYVGTLELRGKQYSLDLSGYTSLLTVGAGEKQITIRDTDIALSLKDTNDGQRLHADFAGDITVGSAAHVKGKLSGDFDDAGLTALSGGGALAVEIPAKGSSPSGSIKGDATVAYTKSPLSTNITFNGDVRVGDALVANASGTLGDNAAHFKGDATYTSDLVTAKGAVDGDVFYGDDLTGVTVTNKAGAQVPATKGDLYLKTASADVAAKGITVSGTAQIGNVGSDKWVKAAGAIDLSFKSGDQPETTVKGNATIDWLAGTTPNVTFDGSIASGSTAVANAKGALDGKKISLAGDVTLSNPDLTIKGAVDGTVYYGADLSGETLKNHAGTAVAASKGDFFLKTASASIVTKGFSVTGNASMTRAGAERFASGGGSVDATYNGTNLKGSADIDWVAGGIPSVNFSGAIANGGVQVASVTGTVDGNKLALKGAATVNSNGFTLKGAIDGLVYYGSDLTGQTITGRDGKDLAATKGDFLIKSASADVTAKGFALSGNASVGKVGTSIWAKGGGNVDLTYGSTNLKGSATADWVNGSVPSVSFAGSLTNGTTAVANASGTFDGAKIALKGDAALTEPSLTLKGSVDGVLYYGADLSAEKVTSRSGAQVTPVKGDYVLKSATGNVVVKGLTLSGGLSLSSVAGEKWASANGTVDFTSGGTTVKGTASASWVAGGDTSVSFDGTVTSGDTVITGKGTIDGKKIAITGSAQTSNAQVAVKGAVDGVVFYGADLTGEKVTNKAGAQVQATKGDLYLKSVSATITTKSLTVTGAATIGSVGTDKWVKGGGSIDATYGTTNLKGSADVDWTVGSIPTVNFAGSITNGTTAVANASGSFDSAKLAFKGDAALTDPALTLKGAVDGVVYYGADLSGEKVASRSGAQVTPVKGDYVIKSASGSVVVKGLTLSGGLALSNVAGEKWASADGAVDLTTGGTSIKGTASASWVAGGDTSVSFDGTVVLGDTTITGKGTIDGKKIQLTGSAKTSNAKFALQGAVDGVVFYGADLTGEKITNRAGTQVQATKGDLFLKSVSGAITAQNLSVSGAATIGSVGTDKWIKGGGSVDATYGATNLKGSADIDWLVGTTPTVNFTGSVTSGTTIMANASGTLDGKKIALKGDLSLTEPSLTLKAAVDGVVYYGADLTGETATGRTGASVQPAKGDYVVKAASVSVAVKNLTVTGNLVLGSLAGDKWATVGGSIDTVYNGTSIKGSAAVAWVAGQVPSVSFDGTIVSGDTTITGKGTIDGSKIAIAGSAKTSNASLALSGAVDGIVYYGTDLTGQTITNRAGAQVQATKGDFYVKSASADVTGKGFTVSGAASLGSVGTEKWVKAGGSVDLTYGATNVKGSGQIDWLVGTTPTVTFAGAVKQGDTEIASASGTLDGAKIALKGQVTLANANLSVKGAVDGVVYYGNDLSAEKVANRSGAMVTPNKGDFVVKSASATIIAKGFTLTGNVSLGKVGSDVWAKGGGSVDLTYNGTNLKGSADVDWVGGQIPSVAFSGSLTNGTALVANASGVVDGKKIQLKGDATVTDGSTTLKGAVDGVVFYGTDLAGQTIADKSGAMVEPLKGDYNFKGVSGSVETKGLTASLGLAFGNVRGTKWLTGGGAVDLRWTNPGQPENRIQGQASIGDNGLIQFAGSYSAGDIQMASVTGTADGKKLVISGDLTTTTASGKATGTLYYGTDLSGETVKNKAGATVAASRGDFSLKVTDGRVTLKQLVATATFSANKVGGNWWVSAAAQVKVGSSWLAFTGDVDSSGDFVLKGNGSIVLDGYHVDFLGTALVRDNRFVIDGTVALVTNLFKVQLTGTIEKPNMDVNTYVFTGKASFKFGSFQVADATVRLTVGEGLATTFSIKTCFLFICPNATYKLYFQDMTLVRAEMNAPIAWAAQFLAIGSVAMGPNVPIKTSITGII